MPCVILEEICHLTVFAKLFLKLSNKVFVLFKGTSAFIIDYVSYTNALSPTGPKFSKCVANCYKVYPLEDKLFENFDKSKRPVFTLVA